MVETAKKQLLDFLDWAGDKGMMKRATARSNKAACNAVLSVLDEEEEADVLAIDLPSVFRRYENLQGMNLSPSTIRSYRQRVRYAIEEFKKYNENRSGWKPSGGQRATHASSRAKKGGDTDSQSSAHIQKDSNTPSEVKDAAQITHRFPLRHDAFVTITGIPFDVKKGEMVRLTSFLANLVASEEEALLSQPMLMASLDEDK